MSCSVHSWYGAGPCPRCVPIEPQATRANLNSRSEIRRAAVQKPDALIAEIERLRAELAKANEKRAELRDAVRTMAPELVRLREALGWALSEIIPQSLKASDRVKYEMAQAMLARRSDQP